MSTIRIKGDPNKYDVKDEQCIGRECLKLHPVSVRAPTNSGSRLAGYPHCCARREFENCPSPIPEFDRKLAAERRKEGLKNVRP